MSPVARWLTPAAVFTVAIIAILLRRIRRDAGGRVDTRYFQQVGATFALGVLALALAHLGGVPVGHPFVVVPSALATYGSAYFLTLFAYSFPLDRPAPASLRVPLLVTTGLFIASTVRMSLDSGREPAWTLLYMLPYFALTVIYVTRNWRLATHPGERAPSASVSVVQLAILAPWVLSLLVYVTLHLVGNARLPPWTDLAQCIAMAVIVVGGVGVAILRYHLFEVRVLLAEALVATGAAALFAAYLGFVAPALHPMLAAASTPALATVVVAGLPTFLLHGTLDALARFMGRTGSMIASGPSPRGVLERVLAATSTIVDPDAVLAVALAALRDATGGEVRFVRHGRTPPGERDDMAADLVELIEQNPRRFHSLDHAPELPAHLLAWMQREGVHLVVPVRREGALHGALLARADGLTRDATLLCATLAEHLALKFENFSLYAQAALAAIELADYRAFLENVVDSLPVGVAVVDPAIRVKAWNRVLERATGVSSKDAVGRHYFDELHPEFKTPEADATIEALRLDPTRVVHHAALPVATDGGERFQDVTVAPFCDRLGQPSGVIVITQDVTDQVRLGRELEASRRLAALGSFAAAIAHDIRTPLTSIAMNVQILRGRANLSADDREYLDIASDEIARLNGSVAEILDFARPIQLRRRPVAPRELLDDVVRTLAPLLADRGVTLDVELAESAEAPPPLADERALRQLLINLIDNAANASARGSTVTVRADLDPTRLLLRVADRGRGIAPENLERIFEPFFTTRPDGTGLGLAIAQKIVRGHDGEITVRSEPERGTTFEVTLPGAAPPN
ncbi:MAG: signal transduction histidine kinase, nitrogen specific, NtrB [Myxococcaceae bacterium]|nr:signal transduction histidine kinase, nitrogen specific, NtrB [Myxococcaceae bacterium]